MTIPQIVERAEALGIDQYIITDHYENVSDRGLKRFFISNPEEHMAQLRAHGLPTGLEFGWDTKTPINYPVEAYDFVLLSFHDLRRNEFGGSIHYESYLEDVWNGINAFHHYTVLAHLDLPRRYIQDNIPFQKKYYPFFEQIFKKLIEEGKGIELNCSTIRQYGQPNPDRDIIELYFRCGGKVLTLGSDAHQIEDIGKDLLKGLAILKEIGFQYLTVYENGEYIFKPI